MDSQINTFIGGMTTDMDESMIKDNQYVYAKNVRIVPSADGGTGSIQNLENIHSILVNTLTEDDNIIGVGSIRDYIIVFTNKKSNKAYNKIIRIDFTESELFPDWKVLSEGDFNIGEHLSIVTNYENADNIKVYFVDGVNMIRLINVAKSKDVANSTITESDFDIVPSSTLIPLEFIGFGTGFLKAGTIQYCYQLFNLHSSESTISSLGKLIPLTESNSFNDSNKFFGSDAGVNVGKSIKLNTILNNSNFTKARILSVYYKDKNSLPVINIVDEIDINGNELFYEDRGNSILSEITIEEFNQLTGSIFIPSNIEKLDNRLFASNIKDASWDIAYDTRAYRCNLMGNVVLDSSNPINKLTFTYNKLTSELVPEKHDCINPYNNNRGENIPDIDKYEYKYSSKDKKFIRGGSGTNVEFSFVNTSLIEDSSWNISSIHPIYKTVDKIDSSCALVSDPVDIKGVKIKGIDNEYSAFDKFNDNQNLRIYNYSDPTIASKYKSYHRDEVYRFAAILYNEKNLPSPAHWICDIRMPKISINGFEAYSINDKVYTSTNDSLFIKGGLITHPLGVQFEFKNIPSEVKGIEIVRCERGVSDRNILMQSAIAKVSKYGDAYKGIVSQNAYRPYPILSYGTRWSIPTTSRDYNAADANNKMYPQSDTQTTNLYQLISPEICVNKENIENVINNKISLNTICGLASPLDESTIEGSSPSEGLRKVMGRVLSRKDDKGSVYSVNKRSDSDDAKYHLDNGAVTNYRWKSKDYPLMWYNFDGGYSGMVGKNYSQFNIAKISKSKDDGTIIEDLQNHDISGLNINVENIEYANNYNYNDSANILEHPTNISQYIYYNWTNNEDYRQGGKLDLKFWNKQGPHGQCCVFTSDNLKNKLYGISNPLLKNMSSFADDTYSYLYSSNCLLMCNVIQNINQYGGNTYNARQNSVYVSTGTYLLVNNPILSTHCFSGDTFIGVLDYASNMLFFDDEDIDGNSGYKAYFGNYIPFETSINLSYRSDKSFSKTYRESDGYAETYVQNEIGQVANKYTQEKPMYAYNDVYSTQPGSMKYLSKSIYDEGNLRFDTRIVSSQAKTNNENIDQWTKFKFADYIDIDSQYGSVNRIYTFNNKMFFWQTNAFGVLAVNERSLINDNNIGALVLGTGGILTRYDYITTKNGSAFNDLKNIINSDTTLYWYDRNKNEICGYGNQLHSLSKIKGVQSYLNRLNKKDTINSTVYYDKKYNEIGFNIDKNATLVFNEQTNTFTSEYLYSPNWYINLSSRDYSIFDNKIFIHNTNDIPVAKTNTFTDDCNIRFIINKNFIQTKTFDNVKFYANFNKDTTIKSNITFNTKDQATYTGLNIDNIDYRENTFRFAIPRAEEDLDEVEKLLNKSYSARLRGKYLECDYRFTINDNSLIKIPYIETTFRYSLV